jgi:hypothetical protein
MRKPGHIGKTPQRLQDYQVGIIGIIDKLSQGLCPIPRLSPPLQGTDCIPQPVSLNSIRVFILYQEYPVRKSPLAMGVVLLCISGTCHAGMRLGERSVVVFATVQEGKRLLETRDDFIRRLSPFDRSARMKTSKAVSEEDFLKFAGENALEWTDAEKARFESAFQGLQKRLKSLSLPFPEKIPAVRTTGNEEGGAAYTRGNAILLPTSQLAADDSSLQGLICHELFHILSRANPKLRGRLYEAIGFVHCGEVEFPASLAARKITNPDAPRNDHCIRLKIADKPCWAIPILFSRAEKYDPGQGGEFFAYIQFRLLLVERSGTSNVKALYDGRNPRLVDVGEVSGFMEQVGRNTDYVIHPEEILANNFTLLAMGETDVPSPELLGKIKKALLDRQASSSTGSPR